MARGVPMMSKMKIFLTEGTIVKRGIRKSCVGILHIYVYKDDEEYL
jgi:hypothetical protein